MEEFLINARKLAYNETVPPKAQIDLATEKGKKLARELGANIDIVEAGTLLMDCAIGQALKEDRLAEHVEMGLQKANSLLDKSSLTQEEKENIRHCILEHHGVSKFYSLESEICCNADCYRFASVKGFMNAVRYTREMPFEDLVKLLNNKVEEKWNAISLSIVKQDLVSQHGVIIKMLENLKEVK